MAWMTDEELKRELLEWENAADPCTIDTDDIKRVVDAITELQLSREVVKAAQKVNYGSEKIAELEIALEALDAAREKAEKEGLK